MTPDLPPYPAYKPSGVPWLGDIPAHWEVRRGKTIFRCIDIRSATGEEELLTVSAERGVIPRRTASVTMFKAESYVGYKLCWPGDLVINSLWAWARGLGVSRHHGIISSAYGVYRLRPQYSGYNAYIHELVRSIPFNWELQVRSKGIWISRLQLTDEAFLGTPFPLPPAPEQHAIARYLDHIDRRIRRYIRAKQKLIALLNEQKQAIIHQAVTRGLDPTVRLKPSGVEWLGDVPEHWDVLPLRRITLSRCDGPFGSGLKSSHYSATGVRVVRLQNIGHAEFRSSDTAYVPETYYATLGDHSVYAGDLLIAGLGDERIPPGRACVAPHGIEPAMVKADCFRFRLNPTRANSDYVALHLSATAVPSAADLSSGATRQRVNLQSTASRPLALPPIIEQKLLVDSVRGATQPLEMAKSRLQDAISLLREYRTRLIADVVTGKVDVRAAAAALPEETPEMDADETADAEDIEEGDPDTDAAEEEA